MENQTKDELFERMILQIMESMKVDRKAVETLIEKTNQIGGCSFVALKTYNSDESGNSEFSDYTVNIGAVYENMLTKDADILAKFDVKKVDVNKYDYRYIDTNGLTLEGYKAAVKAALPTALAELQMPKASRQSNDYYLNKVLIFNTTTLRLSLRGQKISKSVEVEGTYKIVKSAPLTVAKNLIKQQANLPSEKIRRFALDNLNGIKITGDTLIIGGVEKPEQFTKQNTSARFEKPQTQNEGQEQTETV